MLSTSSPPRCPRRGVHVPSFFLSPLLSSSSAPFVARLRAVLPHSRPVIVVVLRPSRVVLALSLPSLPSHLRPVLVLVLFPPPYLPSFGRSPFFACRPFFLPMPVLLSFRASHDTGLRAVTTIWLAGSGEASRAVDRPCFIPCTLRPSLIVIILFFTPFLLLSILDFSISSLPFAASYTPPAALSSTTPTSATPNSASLNSTNANPGAANATPNSVLASTNVDTAAAAAGGGPDLEQPRVRVAVLIAMPVPPPDSSSTSPSSPSSPIHPTTPSTPRTPRTPHTPTHAHAHAQRPTWVTLDADGEPILPQLEVGLVHVGVVPARAEEEGGSSEDEEGQGKGKEGGGGGGKGM
ncbi:hypothetical protein C8R44DRAFT_978532 [Mycena epipterygia]|nr:hypothetical protein C8R44DRAFT_978532 [Mycena epipterygia]